MKSRGGRWVDVHVHPTRFSRSGVEYARFNRIAYSPEGLLAEMDAAGIGWGLFLAPRLAPSLEEQLAEGTRVVRESRGRFLLTGSVDPTRGEGEVARAVALWQESEEPLRAVKLYPGYQPFYVTDRRLDPLLEWAEPRGLPVFIHGGDTSDPNGLLKFARPVDLDELAVNWRSVRFVLCHLGNPWMEEGTEVVYKNPNVYADTSGLLNPMTPYYPQMLERMRRRLEHAVATLGTVERLLYGSDWPITRLEDALSLVDRLPITEADRELVLGGNARRLLGIKEAAPSVRGEAS